MRLPTIVFSELWHRGFLGAPRVAKPNSSYEGQLLSCAHDEEVSEAWEGIAELGGTELWHLTKDGDYRLVDFHSLGTMRRAALLQRAQQLGLITPGTAFKASWFDEDDEGRRFFIFPSRGEAVAERQEDVQFRITPIRVNYATKKLVAYWNARHKEKEIDLTMVDEAAITCVIDAEFTELDGIFWDDKFDPEALSAPRVGLFQRTVRVSRKAIRDEAHANEAELSLRP